ncbi:MAG: hypothetical protein K1X56_04730 [Flavobacteriales bacterium]|nr:hypothetical protein [Flavobacteriales bacterium]
MKKWILLLIILSIPFAISANGDSLQTDTLRFIKVHFLYGSKPAKGFKKTEKKLFGGLHGGHVTIEAAGRNIGFNPVGSYHVFPHKKNKHGTFSYDWSNFKRDTLGKKFLTFIIPVSAEQERIIDSLHSAYLKTTPYDYAMFGYRCASASWDILEEAGILEKKSKFWKTQVIFYPKRIRKRMIRMAAEENWIMVYKEGKKSRTWEKDVHRPDK